jgi:catechol 2,3-dioxygenase-like lactoylglutathione lyase family enzyme
MAGEYDVSQYVDSMHHVGFFCSNLEETVKFYADTFGFEVECYGDVEVADEKVAMLRLGNIILEALWVPNISHDELYKKALCVDNHFSIMVKDIDAVKEILIRHPKVVFEEEEIRNVPNIGDMDLRVTFFRGINGERVEIMQNVRKAE